MRGDLVWEARDWIVDEMDHGEDKKANKGLVGSIHDCGVWVSD
jgi:hypothetical protein